MKIFLHPDSILLSETLLVLVLIHLLQSHFNNLIFFPNFLLNDMFIINRG